MKIIQKSLFTVPGCCWRPANNNQIHSFAVNPGCQASGQEIFIRAFLFIHHIKTISNSDNVFDSCSLELLARTPTIARALQKIQNLERVIKEI